MPPNGPPRVPIALGRGVAVRAHPAPPRLGMSPSGPAILMGRYASQNSGASDFHQPELPHADDRGPLPSPDHAPGRERGGEVDSPALHLLRPARRPGGGLPLP